MSQVDHSPPQGEPNGFGLVPEDRSAAAVPGIVLLGRQGQIRSMDPRAEAMFGCASGDMAGQALESLLCAAPNPGLAWADGSPGTAAAPAPWQCFAGGCTGRRADGATFPIELVNSRLGPAGVDAAEVCFAAFIQDLGREPAQSFELHTVERQLRTLIELAPIAIWVAESDHVVFANRAAGELMGFDGGAALMGKSVYDLLSTADHAELSRHLSHAVLHEGEIGHLQARLVRPNKDVREVEIALAALPDHGRTTVQMVVSNVSQRNRELRDIQRSRHLLKRLSANVVEAREEERRRIARELHDELSQGLSALKMDIDHCARSNGVPTDSGRVAELLATLDGIMTSVRRIASDLRPLMLDDLGLGEAIEALVGDFSRRLGVSVQLQLDSLEPAPDEKISIAVYRMVQEALTNVARHSRASQVWIDLRRAEGELILRVRDDGVGLPSPPPPHRDSQFGLLGMQERADAMGGRLDIQNQRDGGVCLVVHLPVGKRSPVDPTATRSVNYFAS